MSQLTGTVVAELAVALPHVAAHEIASALAILAGANVFALGILRLGWIVDLIPLTALLSFMTGSALSISVGQLPGLFGITGFSTRDATYLVFIHFLQGLHRSTLDAAMGVTSLALLYMLRTGCNQSAKRWPQHKRLFFFLSTLRTVFVILLYTLISWLVNRGASSASKARFKILGVVPAGRNELSISGEAFVSHVQRSVLTPSVSQASRTLACPFSRGTCAVTSSITCQPPSSFC